MKLAVIVGLAVVGLLTLGVDYFLLDMFVEGSLLEARKELWVKSFIIYLILLFLLYVMLDSQRQEKASNVLRIGGVVVAEIVQWVGIGVLIFIGWYLATIAFIS